LRHAARAFALCRSAFNLARENSTARAAGCALHYALRAPRIIPAAFDVRARSASSERCCSFRSVGLVKLSVPTKRHRYRAKISADFGIADLADHFRSRSLREGAPRCRENLERVVRRCDSRSKGLARQQRDPISSTLEISLVRPPGEQICEPLGRG